MVSLGAHGNRRRGDHHPITNVRIGIAVEYRLDVGTAVVEDAAEREPAGRRRRGDRRTRQDVQSAAQGQCRAVGHIGLGVVRSGRDDIGAFDIDQTGPGERVHGSDRLGVRQCIQRNRTGIHGAAGADVTARCGDLAGARTGRRRGLHRGYRDQARTAGRVDIRI